MLRALGSRLGAGAAMGASAASARGAIISAGGAAVECAVSSYTHVTLASTREVEIGVGVGYEKTNKKRELIKRIDIRHKN